MIKRLQQWKHSFKQRVVNGIYSKNAVWVLGFLAFTESIFSPIPADVALMPMSVIRRKKWLWFTLIATTTSVLGAVAGYLIGLGLFDVVGQPLVDFYHLQDQVAQVGSLYDRNTFGAVFIGAFTPIPFKVFTLTGGFFKINFISFVVASILGRGLRYLLIAWLMHRFGEGIARAVYRYFTIFTFVLVAIILIWIFFV